jgi:hypothetical protein
MECEGGPPAGDGVDDLRWASIEEALELLSWERDRELLRPAAPRI